MKILFHNHTGQISGAERVLLMILSGLDRTRFDAVVYCPDQGPLSAAVRGLDFRTVAIDQLSARFTWRPDRLLRYFLSFVSLIRKIRTQVIEEKPDAIHANSIRSGLVMSAATLGLTTPVIWHVHDLLPHHPLSGVIRWFGLISRRNTIVAVSRAVAKRFQGKLLRLFQKRVPVTVIHNAVDLETFRPDLEERTKTRRGLGFNRDEMLVGTVGQLTPRKGQLELLQAFAEVSEKLPNASLHVVGEALFDHDRKYADHLTRAAQDLKIVSRVKFHGQRDDVANLIRAFDLLVVNSKAEPFGLTVVEAMASGTAVLATGIDGIAEIIQHKVNGWLIDSEDQQALATGLDRLLREPQLRSRLSQQALCDVRSQFSRERFLKDFQTFYNALAPVGEITYKKSLALSQ